MSKLSSPKARESQRPMCPKWWQPLWRAPRTRRRTRLAGAFSAAYFPGSRRHVPKAIVAYGAYKRSLGAGEQQLSEAARLTAHAISTEAQAVDDWEDEAASQ